MKQVWSFVTNIFRAKRRVLNGYNIVKEWVPSVLVLLNLSSSRSSIVVRGEERVQKPKSLRCAQINGKNNKIALLIIDQGTISMYTLI